MYKLLLLLGLNLCICVGVAAQPSISVNELKKKMARSDDYVLLDVRTPEEISEGYIEGALNIDFRSDDFQSRISALDKSRTYYVYCASGVRSGKAGKLMLEQGFKSVYSLKGGIKEWREKNLPQTKKE